MKTVVELAKQVSDEGYAPVLLHPEVRRLCELVRADECEEFVAKIQSEIDHAHLNELRLTPSFGKRQGEIAVRASSLDAALDAIRTRGETK